MGQNNIGIDLGTTTTIIYIEGKGIVLDEPSVVAVDTESGKVLAVGDDAAKMVGRTPAHIKAVFPLKDGIISDYKLTKELIRRFLMKVYSSLIVKPQVAVCVPSEISGIENDAVIEAVSSVGARRIYLIEEPMAASLGCGVDIFAPAGHMFVDVGGGTTDVAVVSLGGQVRSASTTVAGNSIDEALIHHLRIHHSIAVGKKSIETLKKEVADCMASPERVRSSEIRGRSLLTGLPQRLTIDSMDLLPTILECVEEIAHCAHSVLEGTPPELAGDIYTDGVILTGGGSLLRGLDEYLSEKLKVNVHVAPDPVNCVALGTGRSIDYADRLESGFRNATPGLRG